MIWTLVNELSGLRLSENIDTVKTKELIEKLAKYILDNAEYPPKDFPVNTKTIKNIVALKELINMPLDTEDTTKRIKNFKDEYMWQTLYEYFSRHGLGYAYDIHEIKNENKLEIRVDCINNTAESDLYLYHNHSDGNKYEFTCETLNEFGIKYYKNASVLDDYLNDPSGIAFYPNEKNLNVIKSILKNLGAENIEFKITQKYIESFAFEIPYSALQTFRKKMNINNFPTIIETLKKHSLNTILYSSLPTYTKLFLDKKDPTNVMWCLVQVNNLLNTNVENDFFKKYNETFKKNEELKKEREKLLEEFENIFFKLDLNSEKYLLEKEDFVSREIFFKEKKEKYIEEY